MFQKITTTNQIPYGHAKDFIVGDEQIAIYNIEGTFYATSDICPHEGGSLGQGELCQGVITCPLHAWQFDVKSGKCLAIPSVKIKTYTVKIEGLDIFVDLG